MNFPRTLRQTSEQKLNIHIFTSWRHCLRSASHQPGQRQSGLFGQQQWRKPMRLYLQCQLCTERHCTVGLSWRWKRWRVWSMVKSCAEMWPWVEMPL